MKSRILEIFLVQIILYLLAWFLNDYLASLVTVIFAVVILLILVVSIIVEWIEPSKVPRWYFSLMALSVLAPIVAALIYFAITGELYWVELE